MLGCRFTLYQHTIRKDYKCVLWFITVKDHMLFCDHIVFIDQWLAVTGFVLIWQLQFKWALIKI